MAYVDLQKQHESFFLTDYFLKEIVDSQLKIL
jgi:hypothetical protein